jgi:hypothetical protein
MVLHSGQYYYFTTAYGKVKMLLPAPRRGFGGEDGSLRGGLEDEGQHVRQFG